MKHVPSVVLLSLLIATPATAQDTTAQVDKLFAWATATSPGCAVAVSHQGKVVVNRAYGLADLERVTPITTDTVFDAASVVKQFVAAAALLLVEEGRLSLTDDIHKYLPELPPYGHTITIDHLMTHTSGIRDWTGLGPLTGRNVDALSLTLRQQALDFKPGEEWAYSNGGYVLLKEIVARASGGSFGQFVQTRLFAPLGMSRTTYAADLRKVVKHRALAYERSAGEWTVDVHLDNQRGGGGALLSTPADLLLWNDALDKGRLSAFVTAKLQEPARLNNGRAIKYARGLFLDTNEAGRVQWHSGGSAGYGTFLARFPDHGLSVATMCNAGEAATGSTYARRIFEMFVPRVAGAPATASATAPSGARPAPPPSSATPDLAKRAGIFFGESDGRPLRLTANDGRLRIAGGPALEAVDGDRFRNRGGTLAFLSGAEFELRFPSADQVELTPKEGVTTRYRRAERFAPTSQELQAFAGRYANEENRVVFEMTSANGGLTVNVSWNNAQTLEFRPADRDAFQLGGMVIRFRRSASGAVVGFDYSNPLVRKVTFERIDDCR
jgi:CubicO group peptidase (beta-lactamase class C family)